MAWKWNPFKRGGKGRGEAPPPPPTAPAPPAGQPPAKSGGLLGRLFGRKKKTEPPAQPPVAPPPPTAPPAPAPPPSGPLPEGEQGELFDAEDAEGKEGEAPAPERQFPASLAVSADGVWKISRTYWDGIMQGILHGQAVKEFILAMEAGNLNHAAQMVADVYDETVAALLDVEGSIIRHIGY
ncbi:hypothetical protein [Streptomyces sp. NPDC017941]|uniref:hypothetical protein n=1 Tax=Streptomyces sp. NPDC017941 TaxID=3365018 RepID=UPI0037B05949